MVDVVNHKGYHNDKAQDETQNQGQGLFQLLPLIHWTFVLWNEKGEKQWAVVKYSKS